MYKFERIQKKFDRDFNDLFSRDFQTVLVCVLSNEFSSFLKAITRFNIFNV
jgi:hypothetical protein